MKHSQQISLMGSKTTFVDVWKWGQELERLHARIAPHFVRPEPRRRALAFLKGIVSSIERKNGWQLAEHAGETRPDGMQRLLNSAVWGADLVRDDLRTYILERLGDPGAIVARNPSVLLCGSRSKHRGGGYPDPNRPEASDGSGGRSPNAHRLRLATAQHE